MTIIENLLSIIIFFREITYLALVLFQTVDLNQDNNRISVATVQNTNTIQKVKDSQTKYMQKIKKEKQTKNIK